MAGQRNLRKMEPQIRVSALSVFPLLWQRVLKLAKTSRNSLQKKKDICHLFFMFNNELTAVNK